MPAPVSPFAPRDVRVPRAPAGGWTIEAVHALPDDGIRYELLDGELFMTLAPSLLHQRAVTGLLVPLAAHVAQHRLGEAFTSPADIVFSPKRLVQPDLFVVPPRAGRLRSWTQVKELLLAIEVLSPSTARADRHRKRVIYQSEGVGEYWIVDNDARLVERWRATDERPEVLAEVAEWQPRADVPPLRFALPEFFARVHDEDDESAGASSVPEAGSS